MAGLVSTKLHVIPPLVERNEVAALKGLPAFGYDGAFLRGRKVSEIADEFGSCHVLLLLGQLTHLLDGLFQ